jgi:hypothetical protein
MSAKSVATILMLVAMPILTSAARLREDPSDFDEDEGSELTFDGFNLETTFLDLADGEGAEVTTITGESGTIFDLGEDSATVSEANEEFEGSEITNLMEVRTKLKFKGNKVDLRNPDMVPTLVGDITGQMDAHAGSKFLLCLHVGTTAAAAIKSSRPGFIEGRSETLKNALHEHDEALKVNEGSTTLSEEVFEHFGSTRFAGLVIKVYGGDAPGCKQDDLVPPSA